MPSLLRICVSPHPRSLLWRLQFWVIPIPLEATTLEPVPVEERRDDDSRNDDRD